MKKLFIFSIIIITSVFFTGCDKDEEKPNQNPTCEITTPTNGQEIKKGETVTISVDAEDKDGSISEVRFFIDGVEKSSASSFPYTYSWNTENENLGNHTLKATSIDNNGGSTSDDISITIIAGGSVPIANFSGTPTSGTVPLTVNFTDQSTNTPTSWQWDFGDGETSTQQNPSHTYNNDESYTITLTATNEYGSDTETKTSYIIVNAGSAPLANFTSDITIGTAPLTVNFTDQSSNTPTSWQWDFGDGGTSTQQNPSHTYNNDGAYTITLTATNEYGSDIKTKNNYIYVGNGGGGEPCPGTPTVTDADGNVYNTVQIGDQCWMKENLRVGTRINGNQNMTNNSTVEKYCYDDDPAYCITYGGFYQWDEMMQYSTTPGTQGICPDGWHLPTDEEWKTMEMELGMSQSEADNYGWRGTDEGKKMKSTSGWNNNGNGTNSSGFTALPGGYHSYDGSFYFLGGSGFWWSSSKSSDTYAFGRHLYYDSSRVARGNDYKAVGYSVRCLKN